MKQENDCHNSESESENEHSDSSDTPAGDLDNQNNHGDFTTINRERKKKNSIKIFKKKPKRNQQLKTPHQEINSTQQLVDPPLQEHHKKLTKTLNETKKYHQLFEKKT